jgi:hypothetical protein
LTPDDLGRFSLSIGGSRANRSGPGDTDRAVKPMPALNVPLAVEAACGWFSAESFTELNPIEQSSIMLLRFIEIVPFESGNLKVTLLASSLPTLRRELPPLIVRANEAAAFHLAVEEGMRGNTQPMVETTARSIETTLDEMIRVATGR